MQDVSKIGFGGRLVRKSDKTADEGLTADERFDQKGKGRERGFPGTAWRKRGDRRRRNTET